MAEQGRRKVAIVGCGVAGLTTIKACLEEGLEPHCFEMNSDLGGVWYTPDSPKRGVGPQMYDSLVTNTSKAMTCFSDFPCPTSYPPYMPHRLFQEYLKTYAEYFHLVEHVSFNTEVLEVRKTADYDVTGCWVVTTRRKDTDSENEEKTTQVYDAVVLCQGFYSIPYIPDIPGLNKGYPGCVSHVNVYKDAQPFKGRTVVVVGGQSSAGDVVCDIAPVAKQVYLSIHQGAYVISRLQNGLTPLDFALNRMVLKFVPQWLFYRIVIRNASRWLNPVTSGLQPEASVPKKRVNLMINDQVPFKILTGQVKVVSEIQRATETGDLHLKDGKVLTHVDDIVFATGYKYDFSVIDPSILISDAETGKLELYKMVFPVSLPHDTLAVVGCLRAFGPIPPILEVQARLVARVLAGRHRLPERTERQRDIDRLNRQQFEHHGCYKYAFGSLAITDNIASELGVKPQWWRLLLRGDLKMALAVMFGPPYPFHYRLMGPHSWPGAREATRRAYNDTLYSMQHRTVDDEKGDKPRGHAYLLFLVPVLAALVYYLWRIV